MPDKRNCSIYVGNCIPILNNRIVFTGQLGLGVIPYCSRISIHFRTLHRGWMLATFEDISTFRTDSKLRYYICNSKSRTFIVYMYH